MARKDAKLCKDIGGMGQIILDLKPKRYMSEVYINETIDVTNLVNYIKNIKDSDKLDFKLTYFHAFLMAIGKTIYNRPLLNRFVANRHVYEHNDVTLSYVMKVDFSDRSKEIMVIMPIKEDDTIFTLGKRVSDKVNNVRSKKDGGSGANNAIEILGKLPNIVRVPIVGAFKLCDKFGVLPKSLVEDNLYYSSMVISNIGTLKCGGIYHNVTDFGTCSSLLTIGEIKEKIVNDEKRYFVELGITMDERIADGFYFIKSLKMIEYILNNPHILEGKANEEVKIKEESR